MYTLKKRLFCLFVTLTIVALLLPSCIRAQQPDRNLNKIHQSALEQLLAKKELTATEVGFSDDTGSIGKRRRQAIRRAELYAKARLVEQITVVLFDATEELDYEFYRSKVENFKLRYVEKAEQSEPKLLEDGKTYEVKVKYRISLKRIREHQPVAQRIEIRYKPPVVLDKQAIATLNATVAELSKEIKQLKGKVAQPHQSTDIIAKQEKQLRTLLQQLVRVEKSLKKSRKEKDKYDRKAPKSQKKYSGLIVVTKGLKVRQSPIPKIYTSGGMLLYSELVLRRGIRERWNGLIVEYAKTVNVAKKDFKKRIGDNPLVVQASGVRGLHHGSLTLSDSEVLKVYGSTLSSQFLQEGRVVFIID